MIWFLVPLYVGFVGGGVSWLKNGWSWRTFDVTYNAVLSACLTSFLLYVLATP